MLLLGRSLALATVLAYLCLFCAGARAAQAFETLADLPVPLSLACGGVSADSHRLAVMLGETTSGRNTRVYVYSTETRQWSTATPIGGPTDRLAAACASIGDKVYMFGGIENDVFMKDLWAYDLNANTWEQLAEAQGVGRAYSAMVALEGRLLLFGGTDATDVPLSAAATYDPTTNAWTATTDMPFASGHLVAYRDIIDNQVMLYGGSATEKQWTRYDVVDTTYTVATSPFGSVDTPPPRQDAAGVTMDEEGDVLFLQGGTQGGAVTNELWRCDNTGDTPVWTRVDGETNAPTLTAQVALFSDHCMYLFGGTSSSFLSPAGASATAVRLCEEEGEESEGRSVGFYVSVIMGVPLLILPFVTIALLRIRQKNLNATRDNGLYESM